MWLLEKGDHAPTIDGDGSQFGATIPIKCCSDSFCICYLQIDFDDGIIPALLNCIGCYFDRNAGLRPWVLEKWQVWDGWWVFDRNLNGLVSDDYGDHRQVADVGGEWDFVHVFFVFLFFLLV